MHVFKSQIYYTFPNKVNNVMLEKKVKDEQKQSTLKY